MSTTSPASTQSPSSPGSSKRSPVERMIVWGGILLLLAIVGNEFRVQRAYQSGIEKLSTALEAGDKGGKADMVVTNMDVKRILGKEPEFRGHPGQILTNSQYYEAYVWRSLFKQKFTAPPEMPEMVDLFAIYSGEVRPDLIKYRTPVVTPPPSFFDANVLYVYYGLEDPKTKAREVVSFSQEREKFIDERQRIPTAEELKETHTKAFARQVGEMRSKGIKLTDDDVNKMDSWKNPKLTQTNRNTSEIPGFMKGGKPVATGPDVYDDSKVQNVPEGGDRKGQSPAPKKDADVKKAPETKAPEKKDAAPKTEEKDATKKAS